MLLYILYMLVIKLEHLERIVTGAGEQERLTQDKKLVKIIALKVDSRVAMYH